MSSQAIPIPGPLSIGDIIDRAFRIYRARFKPMLTTALLLLVPLAILAGALSYFVNEQSLRSTESGDLVGSLGASMGSLLVALLSWLVQGLAELALTFHALAALRNEEMEPRAAISAAAGRLGSWLGMSIIRGLVYGALFLVLILPSVLLILAADTFGMESNAGALAAVGLSCLFLLAMLVILVLVFVLQKRWLVSTPSMVIERLGARSSLGRSWHLTRGKFWRSFGVMFGRARIAALRSCDLSASLFQSRFIFGNGEG